nr:MAG TPA: hypothetical protein [Caudoviricetes sp.]
MLLYVAVMLNGILEPVPSYKVWFITRLPR